ncbi:MAG: adenylosuccinate lyase [Candidatus Binataceae bacterium]
MKSVRVAAAAEDLAIPDIKVNVEDSALLAISSIDGRYQARTRALTAYFSEYALIKYRVRVELEWYLSLAANPALDALAAIPDVITRRLRAIYEDFSLPDAHRVKQLEAATNHDVKAVEYFLREKIAALEAGLPLEMIHFACTSEDISNLAYALILKEFSTRELIPALRRMVDAIAAFAHRYRALPMIARTHGQAASPTTLGKEFAIFAWRLERQLGQLEHQQYLGKCNGAVGNYNAHAFACPEVDWIDQSRRFVEGLGLVWNPLTTQIESHDFLAELFANVIRIDTILIGFARDIWGYISLGYLTQRMAAGEVGSSTMPHKVNPIDFENGEGNLGLATTMFEHLATKLPIARWQRDLTDSTAMRAMGTAFGHVVVALSSLDRGLGKIQVSQPRIAADLEQAQAWEIVAEAVQTLMRRYGFENPYEQLKELTRGRPVNAAIIKNFISRLGLDAEARARLERLTPASFVGLAAELVERFAPAGSRIKTDREPAAQL